MSAAYTADHQLAAPHLSALPPSLAPAPKGGTPAAVQRWFEAVASVLVPAAADSLAAERDAAVAFQRLAKAENTRRAYRAAVAAWCRWCASREVPPLPAYGRDVAAFLASERLRGLTPKTLDLRRAGIRYLHRVAGAAVPTDDVCVSETLAGVRREAAKRGETPRKKAAATANIITQILAAIPDDLRGRRDRALLLAGFVGALRRAELANIRIEHIERTGKGLRLWLPQSKGAQTEAVAVPLPYGQTRLCPVRALQAWLEAAGIGEGAIFRRIWAPRPQIAAIPPPPPKIGHQALSSQAVADIIKARAAAAGFEAAAFGGHSLKRGALTTGMEQGVHPADLKRLGRHKSFNVLGDYLEAGDVFARHPLKDVI